MEIKLDECGAEQAELQVALRPRALDDAEMPRLVFALGSGRIDDDDDDDLAALGLTLEPGT